MIGLILVANSALRDHLGAFRTLGRIGLFITGHTEYLIIFWYEAFGANGRVARETEEAILVELLSLVFHFFHAGLEYLRALVASRRERLIVALATVERVVFRAERLVDERQLAHVTKEALLVPVGILIREVFGVGADFLLTFLTRVGELRFVAFYAVRMLVLEDVARAC